MKRRLDYDFVRFIAMCAVVIFHISSAYVGYGITAPLTFLFAGKNITMGQFGVVLFFIASGATSCMSFERILAKNDRKTAICTYYKKRLLAMLPPFYIAYLVVYFGFAGGTVRGLLRPVMLYTLFGMDGYAAIGGTATCYQLGEWFLGAILILYVMFPALYFLIKKYPVPTWIGLLVFYVLLVVFYPFSRAMDANVLVRIFDFAIGIGIGIYLKNGFSRKWGIGGGVLAALFLFVKLPAGFYEFWITLEGIGAFAFLMWVGAEIQKIPGITSNYVQTVIRTGSSYCYEVFLVHHVIMLQFLVRYSGTEISLRTSLIIITTIVGIIAFWSIILRLIDRYFKEICATYLGK